MLADLLADDRAQFDVVMAIDVFEHVEDYIGFLRNLRSKGRYTILHVPLDISVQSVFRAGRIIRDRKKVGHLHYFTKETTLATLEDVGYRIVDYFYTGASVDLSARGWKANLVRFPRRLLFLANQDIAARVLGGYSLMVLCE